MMVCSASRGAKSRPREPKSRPRVPKTPPRAPQVAPKRPPDRPKSAQRGSRRPPRVPQEAPRRHEETTKGRQTECKAGLPKTGGRAAVSPQRGRQSAARTGGEGRTACFRRNEQAFVQVVEDFGSCSLQLCPHRALDARNGGRSRRMYNLSAVLCI